MDTRNPVMSHAAPKERGGASLVHHQDVEVGSKRSAMQLEDRGLVQDAADAQKNSSLPWTLWMHLVLSGMLPVAELRWYWSRCVYRVYALVAVSATICSWALIGGFNLVRLFTHTSLTPSQRALRLCILSLSVVMLWTIYPVIRFWQDPINRSDAVALKSPRVRAVALFALLIIPIISVLGTLSRASETSLLPVWLLATSYPMVMLSTYAFVLCILVDAQRVQNRLMSFHALLGHVIETRRRIPSQQPHTTSAAAVLNEVQQSGPGTNLSASTAEEVMEAYEDCVLQCELLSKRWVNPAAVFLAINLLSTIAIVWVTASEYNNSLLVVTSIAGVFPPSVLILYALLRLAWLAENQLADVVHTLYRRVDNMLEICAVVQHRPCGVKIFGLLVSSGTIIVNMAFFAITLVNWVMRVDTLA